MLRIGVDVGGTHTDAVLVEGSAVLATAKRDTTANVTTGITAALAAVLSEAGREPRAVRAVMIGTTHFTNAVVERRSLSPVAVVRLGAPATRAVPPLAGWPRGLRRVVGGRTYLCRGGFEFDGRHISRLDEGEIRAALHDLVARGLRSVAVTSVFSPVNDEFERRVAGIAAEECPEVRVSLSADTGRLGLTLRENATVLNACLRELSEGIGRALSEAVAVRGIRAPLFLSQNDGTLRSLEHAVRLPVATFASGPTNSMRGAAFLSELDDCVVADVGGTTSDVGVLVRGFPREAPLDSEIGGVRTNFRMPDVKSIGIGGGSRVRRHNGSVEVGPRSVGYLLSSRSLVFGGDILTATDLAVAKGLADIGDRSLVDGLEKDLVDQGLRCVHRAVEDAVDRMRTTRAAVPLVVVGGGGVLVPARIKGVSRVHRPPYHAVANAVGAAIAQVSGEVDRVAPMADGRRRARLLEEARTEAAEKAVAAGASPHSVRIVEVEEVPLTYLPGRVTRLRVKAVGDLHVTGRQDPAR
ncbi:hydantoinase/oxoprolinase family protein [Streptomyces sp. NPDC005876]|uniref:hydantoinase/oxoprolinase family protein n=1 Tax=unclassified Streptomyces TaxID=2593676 RepID=UPI0033F74D48